MKLLKWIGIGLAVLVAVLVAVGFTLPQEVRVAREITINAPPQQVHAVLDDMQQFNNWSPWYGLDPDATHQFEGPDSGVGAVLKWQGNDDVGKGRMEIVESVPGQRVKVALLFDDSYASVATHHLEPTANGTRVQWVFEAYMDNLIGRYMGLAMDGMIGPDYERGLAQLKRYVEGPAA